MGDMSAKQWRRLSFGDRLEEMYRPGETGFVNSCDRDDRDKYAVAFIQLVRKLADEAEKHLPGLQGFFYNLSMLYERGDYMTIIACGRSTRTVLGFICAQRWRDRDDNFMSVQLIETYRRRRGVGESLLLELERLNPGCTIKVRGILPGSEGFWMRMREKHRRFDILIS